MEDTPAAIMADGWLEISEGDSRWFRSQEIVNSNDLEIGRFLNFQSEI
jgi:hypothetical protein